MKSLANSRLIRTVMEQWAKKTTYLVFPRRKRAIVSTCTVHTHEEERA